MTKRTMLITGASGGMGSACALLAAERGYDLLLSDINNDKLKAIADACMHQGVAVNYQPLDIADADAVAAFLAELQNSNAFDAVIHTVGLSPHMAAWEKIIQVDLVSTIEFLNAIKAYLMPGGCSVCISSMSAHMIPPNADVEKAMNNPLDPGLLEHLGNLPDAPVANSGMAYAYAKKALINYVNREAKSWGEEGKRLVSISPGLIDTDMGKLEAESDKDTYALMRPLVALKRDGLAREIATAALFLASDDASYITGCDLLVDGGFVASVLSRQQQS